MPNRIAAAFLLAVAAGTVRAADPANIADLRRGFENPPDEARIMVRWWWFGPAVNKTELEREMRLMKEGGIGGFEVQPVYPLQLEGNLKYLSPEFLDCLTFVGQKAREVGLRMDLTLGSGWPFGGPHIPLEEAAGRLRAVKSATAPTLNEGEQIIAEVDGTYFIAGHTRQQVKRPAVGAEGFVLDHCSRAAIDRHLRMVGEPLLGALAKTPPYAIFSDSLEVYNSDWTADFLAEFQRRRGYDLKPVLPALLPTAPDDDKTRKVRRDWGKTLSELADERYLTPIREWAQKHGTRFRSQTYGIPPVTLSSNALVDLPEGEGWHWRTASTTRWASSASHLYGRPVTSSETWTWLHSPVFRATPLDMKAEADLHFLEGINQLVGHGWPYSPPEAGEPGWRFYASAVFNNHNPWWIAMPDITRYLQRVSWILRQGQPANDVALYVPTDDAFASFTLGRNPSVNQALDRLFGPELIPEILDAGYNFDLIDDAAIAQKHVPYRVLVVPRNVKVPETGERLTSYAILTAGDHSGEALHKIVPADLAAAPEIGFIHRKLPFAEVYFVVNTSNHAVHTPAKFRVTGMEAATWDPFTGKVARASASELDLAPYESRVFVFSKERAPEDKAGPATDLGAIFDAKPWPEKFFSGTMPYETKVRVERLATHMVLGFGQGTAVASQRSRQANSFAALLDGPVREAAVVFVNGQRAGSVWCPPYELDIRAFLHTGENSIRIEVANTALNLLSKGPLPDYKELTAKFGERFQAQDMQLVEPLPSGLLHAVHLVAR